MKRNPEKARVGMRRWRVRHPEEKRAQARAYYESHRDGIIAKVRDYFRDHPEAVLAHRQTRRGRELSAQGTFTAAEWNELLDVYGHRCAYCGMEGRMHADHAIPLCRGGTGWIWNMRPACGPCNQSKYTLTEGEYRERRAREGLYVRPRVRLPLRWVLAWLDGTDWLGESSGSFSASLMSFEG